MSDALVIEVVRKTVTVDCAVEEAFRVFTTDALSWWPVESHSIHQTVSEIVFEPRTGGEVYEVAESGERGHWATVLEWDPPRYMGTSWENGYMNDEIFRAHLGWIGLEQYDETNEVGQRFLDRFAEVHGRRPEYIMPIYGHDVGQAFVAAFERAEPLSPRGVMEALERVKMVPAADLVRQVDPAWMDGRGLPRRPGGDTRLHEHGLPGAPLVVDVPSSERGTG